MLNLPLRAAAIQFRPELGNVDVNLEKSRCLVRQAISMGATCIVLPEFFTTGITFDDSMLMAYRPVTGEPTQMLIESAKEGGATIGGSFLAESGGHVFNTFVLAHPNGQVFTHDKDFPSGPIEHAYYCGGEDEAFLSALRDHGIPVTSNAISSRQANNQSGVFALPEMSVGVALCWEMIRHRTVARLLNKVDLVLAGSAWMELDSDIGFPGMNREAIVDLNATLLAMLKQAPIRLAELLGVPVVHANLVGPLRAHRLFGQQVDFITHFAGESQIVAPDGTILASRPGSAGEGVVVADIPPGHPVPADITENEFWIPRLTPVLQSLWYEQGLVGREYYLHTTVPRRLAHERILSDH